MFQVWVEVKTNQSCYFLQWKYKSTEEIFTLNLIILLDYLSNIKKPHTYVVTQNIIKKIQMLICWTGNKNM